MANITLSLQDDLLKKSRQYARKHNTSLNALIKDLITKQVQANQTENNIEEFIRLAEKANVSSKGKKRWTRNDLYDV